MKIILFTFAVCGFFFSTVSGQTLPVFTHHKLDSGVAGNTLLVVAGIQGDEPGGFNAAGLLATQYNITKGSVWVVPNLNFISIIRSSRGVHGDLNRKFDSIQNVDPEFETIRRIKSIILDKQVDLILNLHDGSGYFREKYIDKNHSPYRWGQSIIIDQETLDNYAFGNLLGIANEVAQGVNKNLYSEEHAINIKNTKTREGDLEMAKTLTYFACRHLKPAFGLEASKSLPVEQRVYYHLNLLENFMETLGIEYERKFDLSFKGVSEAINNNIKIAFFDSKIILDLENARKRLRYIPLKRNSDIQFTPSNPLLAVIDSGSNYQVYYGNRLLTNLHPQYFAFNMDLDTIGMDIDGQKQKVNMGDIVDVNKTFTIEPLKGYRVNVIGFTKSGTRNEVGIAIDKKNIRKKFSVDKNGKVFRVEVYRDNDFSGMVLVNFNDDNYKISSDPIKKVELVQLTSESIDSLDSR